MKKITGIAILAMVASGCGGSDDGSVVTENSPPEPVDDTASLKEDRARAIDVLSNDADADGDELTVVSADGASSGSIAVNADQTITYAPDLNFSGPDSFTYRVSDGTAERSATVDVTVSEDRTLIYSADDEEQGTFELRAVDTSSPGDGVDELASAVLPDTYYVDDFDISPVGKIAFWSATGTGDNGSLYLVDPAEPDDVSPVHEAAAGDEGVQDALFGPEGRFLAFVADRDTQGKQELYLVDLENDSAPVRMNGAIAGDVAGKFVRSRVAFAADGQRLLFVAEGSIDTAWELFSVPIDSPGSQTRLSAERSAQAGLNTNSGIPTFVLSPDGADVAYFDEDDSGDWYIRQVPADGSAPPVAMTPGPITSDRLPTYAYTGDGEWLIYNDEPTDVSPDKHHLYAVSRDTPGTRTEINGAVDPVYGIGGFQTAGSGDNVYYVTDDEGDEAYETFRVAASSPGQAEQVSRDSTSSLGGSLNFRVAPDESALVYTWSESGEDLARIYYHPIGGSEVPVSADFSANPDVELNRMFFSPQSGAVIYSLREYNSSSFVDTLYRVEFDDPDTIAQLNRDTAVQVSGENHLDIRRFDPVE